MKRICLTLAIFLFVLSATASIGWAATILADNFESYANTAAMNAVWTNGGTATLSLTNGNPNNPGKSLNHPGTAASFSGGNTNTRSFASVYPAAGEVLTFMADIYDDGTSANKRVSAGIRTASGANIIEMGMYNGPTHYAHRTILFGTPGGTNWVAFANVVDDNNNPINNTPVVGWHRYSVSVTPTMATFTLDLNSNGFVNATSAVPIGQNAAGGFNIVRLGGPSDVNSAGGGVDFDNIKLAIIPEPAAVVIAGLGVLLAGAIWRRR